MEAATIAALQPLFAAPKLTEKILSRPPVRFIHDVVVAVSNATGFPALTDEEKDFSNLSERDAKVAFLEKVIAATAEAAGKPAVASAKSILGGKEAENTNSWLQDLGAAGQAAGGGGAPAEAAQPKKSPKVSAKKGAAKKAAAKGGAPKKAGAKKSAAKGAAKKGGAKKAAAKKGAAKKGAPKKAGKASSKKAAAAAAAAAAPEPEGNASEALFAEVPSRPSAVEMSSGNESVSTPGGGRPMTARAAPPRVASNVRTVEKLEAEDQVKENSTVIVEEDEVSEDELDLGDDLSESDDDDAPDAPGIDVEALADGAHTGLVKSMLDDVREEARPSRRKAEESLQVRHQKEVLEKDVAQIRDVIQQITRSTNPLGKTMDYIQEDFEHMNKELDGWKTQRTDQSQRLEEEQQVTEESLQPLHATLAQVENEIREWQEKIHRLKQTVDSNDTQIARLLGMVINR